jgi:hypothetical protein
VLSVILGGYMAERMISMKGKITIDLEDARKYLTETQLDELSRVIQTIDKAKQLQKLQIDTCKNYYVD